MDTSTLIMIGAVAVILLIGLLMVQKQRSAKLRERFGPEYEHTVSEYGDQRRAEAELAARQKRVEKLNIHPLSPEDHDHFASAWQEAQARFVDDPSSAIVEANQLVKELMAARGYPVGDFEQRAADISVDHPNVVMNYRAARDIAMADRNGNGNGRVSTEDLRQAMVHYRALFEELLETDEQPVQKTEEVAG